MAASATVMLVASASRSSGVMNSYGTVGSLKYAHAWVSVSRIRSSKYRTLIRLRPRLRVRAVTAFPRHDYERRRPQPHCPPSHCPPPHCPPPHGRPPHGLLPLD